MHIKQKFNVYFQKYNILVICDRLLYQFPMIVAEFLLASLLFCIREAKMIRIRHDPDPHHSKKRLCKCTCLLSFMLTYLWRNILYQPTFHNRLVRTHGGHPLQMYLQISFFFSIEIMFDAKHKINKMTKFRSVQKKLIYRYICKG